MRSRCGWEPWDQDGCQRPRRRWRESVRGGQPERRRQPAQRGTSCRIRESPLRRWRYHVAEQYGHRQYAVERELAEQMQIPAEAHSVSVSLERVSVPMEEPRTASGVPMGTKAPKRPVQRVYRMAYAATVTLHDDRGQALRPLRYGRMPRGDIDGLCTALGALRTNSTVGCAW
jgi:hypothetical protein